MVTMRRPKKDCFGLNVSYPLACSTKATVCRAGKVDLFASDDRIMAAVRKAVPRIPEHVDSGAGPFCCKGHKGPCKTPMRDLQIDSISICGQGKPGLTKDEMAKLVRALSPLGVKIKVFADHCRLEPLPRKPRK